MKEWGQRQALFAHDVHLIAVHGYINLFWNGLYWASI